MSQVRKELQELVNTDRRGAVWCAALCASTVRHIMPAGARPALRLAFLWAQGVPVSGGRLDQVADAAMDIAASVDPLNPLNPARLASWSAACAARAARLITRSLLSEAGGAAHVAGATYRVVSAAEYATRTIYASATDAAHSADPLHLKVLIDQQLTPLDRPGYSVLGDWLQERYAERCKEDRVGTLGGSLGWARHHRLRWWDAAERYAAERRIRIPSDLVAAHRRAS